MVDVVLPPISAVKSIRWRTISPAGGSGNQYTGEVRSRALGGDRMGCSIDFSVMTESARAQTLAFIGQLRGQINTALIADPSYRMRGSFPGGELLTNFDFSSAHTVGWNAASPEVTPAVVDGEYRATVNRSFSSSVDMIRQAAAATVNQYMPHLMRWLCRQGKFLGAVVPRWRNGAGTAIATGASVTAPDQLIFDTYNIESTTAVMGVLNATTTGNPIAGDYLLIPYASAAQCIQIDGGGNLALRSDAIDDAAWTKSGTTTSANADAAPDGTTTADRLIENGANSTHIATQSGLTRTSEIADLCTYAFVRRAVGTRNLELIVGNNFTNYVRATFDLTTLATNVGNVGTATNGRAFIADAGNGYYFCAVVGRMEAAATAAIQVGLLSGTTSSYAGDSTSALDIWRAGIVKSSVPTRGTQTTSAAIAPAAAPKGVAFLVKGLPASTQNLLRKNDYVSVHAGTRIFYRQLATNLNSDAAGLGRIEFTLPIPYDVPADSPIAIHRPLARMVCVSKIPEWLTEPGIYSTATLDFEEKYTA
jgi:hypothetical protein